MKNNFKFYNKIIICALIFGGMMGIWACESTTEETGGNVISLAKDGSIQASIEDSFDQSYYDKDELEQSVLKDAAAYNNSAGDGKVSVDKVEVKDTVATVQITYAGSQDYASFNKVAFFVGSAKEAEEAGYDLNVVLSGVKDANNTIGKADILASEGQILITDVSDSVALSGTAVYVSDNVVVSSNGKVVRRADEGNKLAYVIYE